LRGVEHRSRAFLPGRTRSAEPFEEVLHEPFTIAGYLRTLRTCRLFDYEQHRWLDWDGTPTTGPLVVGRVAGTAAAERLVEVGRS
jgi:hypothetical protein